MYSVSLIYADILNGVSLVYDPASNETFLDMSDPTKLDQILRENQIARRTFGKGTYLTEIKEDDITEILEEIDDCMPDQKPREDRMIPLEAFENGELGIKLENLKFVIKNIHLMMKNILRQTFSKSTQTANNLTYFPELGNKKSANGVRTNSRDLHHFTTTGISMIPPKMDQTALKKTTASIEIQTKNSLVRK